MGWVREAHVYAPAGEAPWLMSHASVPFAETLNGSIVRAWFSPRDGQNRSLIAWIMFDLHDPTQILDRSPGPILDLGASGAFDDCGTMMSWLIGAPDKRQLYYIGWSLHGTVPFHVAIGLAREQADGTWHKVPGPVLDRSTSDPFFCSNPCVIATPRGLSMWYLSGLGWETIEGGFSPSYDVRQALSKDGRTWVAAAGAGLRIQGSEFAIARPCVVRRDAEWLMWFSVRTRDRPYRLGAARSEDGRSWIRAPDLADLPVATAGWDSEMIAYPHVFEQAGETWMLYCGNGFGRSGFGLARWR